MYSAHSTRAASTSAAAANGSTVDEIMTHVGWSNANTFATFYNKHGITTDSDFSDKVLQSNNSWYIVALLPYCVEISSVHFVKMFRCVMSYLIASELSTLMWFRNELIVMK